MAHWNTTTASTIKAFLTFEGARKYALTLANTFKRTMYVAARNGDYVAGERHDMLESGYGAGTIVYPGV